MAEPIPESAADAADFNYPAINREWAGLLVGLLDPLRDPDYWDGDEVEQSAAINQVELLQLLLMNENPVSNITFQATGSLDQVIASPESKITLTTEIDDIGGYYDHTNSRYTPLMRGRYRFWAYVNGYGSSVRGAVIKRNGNIVASTNAYAVTSPISFSTMFMEIELEMNGSTDWVELWGTASSGGYTCIKNTRQTVFGGRLVAW